MDVRSATASTAPSKGINDIYQKIDEYGYEMRMIEIDEYLYGMDRKKIDREKACELIIDIPISTSNATMNFWKGRVVDPRFPSYKSSRVEKNTSVANEFYR